MTARDRRRVTVFAFVLLPACLFLGACGPLWAAMPWAVAP